MFVIERDVLLANLGQRKAFLTKRHLQRDAGIDDLLRNDRVTRFDGEGVA